ncbi:MAG: DUF2064 domain-containing protein [Solirubrobacteraceae bacterium]
MPGALQRPAVLVMAGAAAGSEELDARLGPDRASAVRALLHGRAVAWAQAVAPGAVWTAAADETPVAAADRALAEHGGGPLLVAWPDLQRWRPEHASAALEDLADGCRLALGPVFDGGFYLLAFAEPLPAVLELAAGPDVIGLAIAAAHEAQAQAGLLRPERGLHNSADVAAALADPLLDPELRTLLTH